MLGKDNNTISTFTTHISDRQIDRMLAVFSRIDRQNHRYKERQRESWIFKDRQIERQTESQIFKDRQIERQTESQIYVRIDRQKDRQKVRYIRIDRQKDRQKVRYKGQIDRQIDRFLDT